VTELPRERQTKKWTDDATGQQLRKPSEQRKLRSTQQEQSRSDGREEQVLHHMNRERDIVQRFERRTNCDPDCHESCKESGESPDRKLGAGCNAQAMPTSCIKQGGETERCIHRKRGGPRLQDVRSMRIHKDR